MIHLQLQPARKKSYRQIFQLQDSGFSNCDASDDSNSNKRPYVYDSMSAGCIIVRNYTYLPRQNRHAKLLLNKGLANNLQGKLNN